jgi:hypothetical protein
MHEVVDVRGSAHKAHEGGASVASGVALVHW